MANCIHGRIVRIFLALGCPMLMTGCALAPSPSLPTDLVMFVRQFAREALAAFLF